MTNTGSNLRKAAILIRSLDADTAASLLAQLSPAETAAIRQAIRAIGPFDDDEQADVVAEFRRVSPLAGEPAARGVELVLSPAEVREVAAATAPLRDPPGKRFQFLENAPVETLSPCLAREHAQTIAVVLSHLAPDRAAALLAALPGKLQAETIERLSTLGETDPESVIVLERELAAWVANRVGSRKDSPRRNDAMAAILSAADATTRTRLLANLKTHKSALADRLAPVLRPAKLPAIKPSPARRPAVRAPRSEANNHAPSPRSVPQLAASAPRPTALPHFEFDDLIHLDGRTLAAVLRATDGNVLALALAGSRDELIDRIGDEMPKPTAQEFRRALRRLGPTRLSDVEAAQRAVARTAAQQLAERRRA